MSRMNSLVSRLSHSEQTSSSITYDSPGVAVEPHMGLAISRQVYNFKKTTKRL